MTKCCKFEVPVVDEFPRREIAGGVRLVPLLHPFQSGSVFPQTLKTAARNNPSSVMALYLIWALTTGSTQVAWRPDRYGTSTPVTVQRQS